MSYSIRLRPLEGQENCPTCGRRVETAYLPDPTYNLTPLFHYALSGARELPSAEVSEMAVVLFRTKTESPRGLRLLSGKRAGDTLDMLQKAVERLDAADAEHRTFLRSLEPDNGWGDLDGARKVLLELLDAAQAYPEQIWEIH